MQTCHTPDSGYMGDRRRGASLGRSSRNAATMAETAREDVASIESTLAALQDPTQAYLFAHLDAAGRSQLAARLRSDLTEARRRLAAAERAAADPAPRFHLRRVRLDSGGYDAGGAYWGHGAPLFEAFSEDGVEFLTLRAADREAARAEVLEAHPRARFFR